MGGHGGLNILPQKSWNVYGQRNRQKVAVDEAEQKAKEAAVKEQQDRHDRQARLTNLRSTTDVEAGGDNGPAEETPAEHINFWHDFETASKNPEVEAEEKAAARKRGDKKTQTSDARFDAQFSVMHGLSGPAPWYARHKRPLDDASPDDATKLPGHRCDAATKDGCSVDQAPTKRSKADKKDRKEKRHKDKRRRRHRDRSPLAAGPDMKSFDELRKERMERERTEAARTRALLQRHHA